MGHHSKKKPGDTKEKLKILKKERKQKLKEKRARLIIRNLPFESTEENLKEYFEKFGEVNDVKILKTEGGKLKGCGFIQFKLVQKAAKARHHTNGKPFLGRNISVDFSLPKNKYAETNKTEEPKQEDEVEIKEEPTEVDSLEEENLSEGKDEDIVVNHGEVKSEDEGEGNSSDEDDHSDNEDTELEEEEKPKRPRVESHDVREGKTIFIKNVPFSATNDDLKECMEQYGPVHYALICIDKYTEHSKGTAFVKFQQKEDAEKALNAGTELTLLGNVLDCHQALERTEIQKKIQSKIEETKGPKDSRNLYLIKEGLILAGSKAAEGVSATDMAKRLQLEQYKNQMLKNLNMFISRERLIIHNLPASWDDKKLRNLFKKYSPKNAVIKEAKVMRDLRNVDAKGVGRSKEFGFVAFGDHEDALIALRAINNNPDVFNTHKRPIVGFSIEKKSAMKAKQKRLDKSKMKNPMCKDYNPKVVQEDKEKRKKYLEKEEQDFVGVSARPGVQKMRSRYNLKTQAKLHYENLKKEKKKKKVKVVKIKQPKQKIIKKTKNDDSFSKLVESYKKKLHSVPEEKRVKWFEQ